MGHRIDPPRGLQGLTPQAWKISKTVLLDKNKGEETQITLYRPVGLANTLYKLWIRMVTNAMYEYAECNSATHKQGSKNS